MIFVAQILPQSPNWSWYLLLSRQHHSQRHKDHIGPTVLSLAHFTKTALTASKSSASSGNLSFLGGPRLSPDQTRFSCPSSRTTVISKEPRLGLLSGLSSASMLLSAAARAEEESREICSSALFLKTRQEVQ